MRKAMQYIVPFIANKASWPLPPDVMYFDRWPVRQSALLFAGLAYGDESYLDLWKSLDADPTEEEVIRNYPIRQPVLWVGGDGPLPDLYLIDRRHVAAVKTKYRNGEMQKHPAIRRLFREADDALSQKPVSVMEKEEIPPGGTRHDYMSVAPYWWPDTTKPAGAPYIRRDGERNPDRAKVGDRKRIGDLTEAVATLSLAYYIGGNEDHARHAARLLRTWFLDTATAMNPNLEYAQAIRGRTEGRGSGIIDTYSFAGLIDALELLRGSPFWTDTAAVAMSQWFRDYLHWLRTSDNGMHEAAARNNHGTTYDVQTAMIALFAGESDLARSIIDSSCSRRIATQVEPDGRQPLELARTRSWNYSLLNLDAMFRLAMIGERLGLDLWSYTTGDGRSIRKALDWMIPFALGEREWTTTQIVPLERESLYPLLRIAAVKYADSTYSAAATAIMNDKTGRDRSNILYPDPEK
jgi:hypothetical protein